jgi:MFS family permease
MSESDVDSPAGRAGTPRGPAAPPPHPTPTAGLLEEGLAGRDLPAPDRPDGGLPDGGPAGTGRPGKRGRRSWTGINGGLGPAFGRLWGAAGISTVGDGLTQTAVPLLAATLTRDPFQIGLISAVQYLPWLLLGLPGGALVDRWDRVRTMWTVDLARAAVIAALAGAVLGGAASIPLLVLAAFGLGTGQIFFDGAAQAAIPTAVGRDQARLHRANGRLLGTRTVGGSFVGPPLGGLLFAAARWLPFVADAVSFLASSALIGSLRGRLHAEPTRPRRRLRTEMAEGLRFLLRHQVLRTCAFMACVCNLAAAASFGLLVLLAQDRLHLGSAGFGALLTAEAVGALVGSAIASRLAGLIGTATAFTALQAAFGLMTVLIGLGSSVALVVLGLGLTGLTVGAWNVLGQSLRQELTPGHLMGRVVTAFRMFGMGGAPLGGVLGGLLARHYGLSTTYVVAGLAVVVSGLVATPILTEPKIAAARAAINPAA